MRPSLGGPPPLPWTVSLREAQAGWTAWTAPLREGLPDQGPFVDRAGGGWGGKAAAIVHGSFRVLAFPLWEPVWGFGFDPVGHGGETGGKGIDRREEGEVQPGEDEWRTMSHGLALPGDVDDVVVEAPPLVLLNVCDSYLRRNEGQERVIGTLLGTLRGNVVVVKNSYAVPHNESDEQVGRTEGASDA